MGQYTDSIDALQNTLALGTTIQKSYVAISLCHQHLATSLRMRGDYTEAINQYQIAMTIRQRNDRFGGSSGLTLCLMGCAAIFIQLGHYQRFKQAQEYLERALAIALCMKSDSEELGHVLYQSGMLLLMPPPEQRETDWETTAWQKFDQAKTIFQNACNITMTALCQREMAMVLFRNTRDRFAPCRQTTFRSSIGGSSKHSIPHR
jgi:tetratricopeptide (TPR) repeat protein